MKSYFGIIFALFFIGFVSSGFSGCEDPICDLKISGKVMDEDGNPLKNIEVTAFELDSCTYCVDSVAVDSVPHKGKLWVYFMGNSVTDKDGKYEIVLADYIGDMPRGKYRLKAQDVSNVFASDSTENLQWFKVSPGQRHETYNGGFLAQYKFTLKRN